MSSPEQCCGMRIFQMAASTNIPIKEWAAGRSGWDFPAGENLSGGTSKEDAE